MKAPVSVNVLPANSSNPDELMNKLNELIRKVDEVYRILRSDVQIMDLRELPPHYAIDHASWKWYEDPTTGDLRLYHRSGNIWSDTGWSVIGDLTRPTQPVIT